MKDRPALHMVKCARARGALRPGARIIESSSGTLGLGLALAGMVYRHPVTVVAILAWNYPSEDARRLRGPRRSSHPAAS